MFWETYVELCRQKGLSPSAAAAEMGLSNSAATQWKRGSIPSPATLNKISEYFCVPASSLLDEENHTEGIKKDSPAENSKTVNSDYSVDDLIAAYNRADDSTKAVVRLLLKF